MNQQEGFFLFYSQDEEKQSSLSSKAGEQGNKSICCLPSPFLNQILWEKSYYLGSYFSTGKQKLVVYECVNTYMNLSAH